MSAADPQPLLPIRSRYRGPAFRGIETVLREDPVLASVVKTWRSREGADTDMQMPAWDMMPLIGLSPIPSPNAMEAIDLTRINFQVSVQMFVPGTCVDDILALWEAVEDAIVRSRKFRAGTPHETTVGEYLCSLLSPGPGGVVRLWPTAPAFFPVDLARQANDQSCQMGVGTLSAFILRPA